MLSTAHASAQSRLSPSFAIRLPRFSATFSSLRSHNFRIYACGQLVSNVGAWVQRIAQDWLVLTMTGSATAVGVTTALQFVPTLLFGLHGGLIADRYSKRRVLLATQAVLAVLAAALAVLTLTNQVAVWHVFVIAFATGVAAAVDNPTRQSFVNEMVGPAHLHNAISINSSVFQIGALVGPAVSGLLISAVGSGYSFAINAVSYLAPIIALLLIRSRELVRLPPARAGSGRLNEAVRYSVRRPRILWPIILVGVFGAFTANLPVTLSAYAKSVFHSGPSGYALLSTALAVGSLTGALISARRPVTRLHGLTAAGLLLAAFQMIAAATPNQWSLSLVLAAVGAANLVLGTSANSTVQLAAGDSIRGRVMGLYVFVFVGSAALGGPLLGAIAQFLGPRMGMLLAGAIPAAATVLFAAALTRGARSRSVGRPEVHDGRASKAGPDDGRPVEDGVVDHQVSAPPR